MCTASKQPPMFPQGAIWPPLWARASPTGWISPASSSGALMINGPDQVAARPRPVIYFDGMSSRRRTVALGFVGQLEINEDDRKITAWSYADIRRAASP